MNTRCGLGRMGKSRDEKADWHLARGPRTGETEMELMQAWSSLTTRSPSASLSHPQPHHVPASLSLRNRGETLLSDFPVEGKP